MVNSKTLGSNLLGGSGYGPGVFEAFVPQQEIVVAGQHRFFLEGPFHGQKAASKLLNDAFYAYLTLVNQAVGWVRPRYDPRPSIRDHIFREGKKGNKKNSQRNVCAS
jgi:hypothetical protein